MNTQVNKTASSGWVKAQPLLKRENVEKNPVVIAAVAAMAPPLVEAKPISEHKATRIIGIHRSPALGSLLKTARHLEDIREIIDQANKDVESVEDFEENVEKIAKEIEEEKPENSEKVKNPTLSHGNIERHYNAALSKVVLEMAKSFSKDRDILQEELKLSAEHKDHIAKLEKKFYAMIEHLRWIKKVRGREEQRLIDDNITNVGIVK